MKNDSAVNLVLTLPIGKEESGQNREHQSKHKTGLSDNYRDMAGCIHFQQPFLSSKLQGV